MSIHIMIDHKCSKCQAYYIPYEKGIVCPRCGLEEESGYGLILQLVTSAKYQKRTTGHYSPMAWWIGSFGDYVAVLVFEMLDKYSNQDQKEFKEIAREFCDERDWKDEAYMKEHIFEIACRVFKEMESA